MRTQPWINSGINSGINPGIKSGINLGINPGINPGINQGINSGINPGINPGINRGQTLNLKLQFISLMKNNLYLAKKGVRNDSQNQFSFDIQNGKYTIDTF